MANENFDFGVNIPQEQKPQVIIQRGQLTYPPDAETQSAIENAFNNFGQNAVSQILFNNNNINFFSFGDGSDSDVTIAAPTTLAADAYYKNLIVNAGITLNTGSSRIFVSDTLNNYGTIARNGAAGGVGATGVAGGGAGGGGVALADGYLKGSVAGGNGGQGGDADGVPATGAGIAGTATSNSIGGNGAAGGAGGAGTVGAGGGAGAAGVATASNVKLIANWHLATLLDVAAAGGTVKFDNSAGSGGGGGGGTSGVANEIGGGGGGAGSAGGIVAIYAKKIFNHPGAVISANGGIGGNGGIGQANNGSGGGGGGGNGGQIILVYNVLDNKGSITVAAGAKGSGGAAPGGGGFAGVDGSAGAAGTIRQFQLSL